MKGAATPYGEAWKCNACGSGSIHPRPQATQIASFYDFDSYYTHDAVRPREPEPSIPDKILVKIAWWLDRGRPFDPVAEAKAGYEVVDLGCGDGEMLKRLKGAGCEVVGVDPDPLARRAAEEHSVTVLDGTAESLPAALNGRQFDLVIMSHSLEHCRDARLALRNAFGLTKPGGTLYVEVPNCRCVHFTSLGICSGNFDAPRHLWFFTPDSLKRTVTSAGFTPKDWRYHGFTRHHQRSWREWEMTIADRIKLADPARKVVRHSFASSVSILLRSAFASFQHKYDAVGIIAVRNEILSQSET